MIPTIRRAGVADAEILDYLAGLARTAATSVRGGPDLVEGCRSIDWQKAVLDPVRLVLVSTLEDHPVGFLLADLGSDIARVDGVFVQEEARELGCGDGLLEEAIDVARRRGCRRIDATALPGDRQTKNLYERAGVVARAITVSKVL